MFESKYSKVLTIILVIVIVAIVILLGFLAYDYINKFSSTKQASDFVEDYQGNITTSEEDNTNNSQENVALDSTNEVPITDSSTSGSTGKKKYKGYTVVGTMKIPAINLEYPIFEEITTKALETGLIALYPNGDNINQVGNTVIIGHNYRNGMFFSNLKKLSNGAKIYIKDFRGTTLTYEVYNKFEASSTDTSFYTRDTNGVAEITLSTCTDASNDQRTILFAKQI
jgi:LPXTG-site transpeptidase (sortase) family protein